MTSQEKCTILYGRLSQEDMRKRSGKEDDSKQLEARNGEPDNE